MLVEGLAVLLDGRRRPAERAWPSASSTRWPPPTRSSHALDVARRVALGDFKGALWSPLTDTATMAFPNIERDPDIRRLLEHHARIPRLAPAQAILDLVRLGFADGLQAGLAAEAEKFGRLVASEDGHAGLDRFLARKSSRCPSAGDDLS